MTYRHKRSAPLTLIASTLGQSSGKPCHGTNKERVRLKAYPHSSKSVAFVGRLYVLNFLELDTTIYFANMSCLALCICERQGKDRENMNKNGKNQIALHFPLANLKNISIFALVAQPKAAQVINNSNYMIHSDSRYIARKNLRQRHRNLEKVG